MSPETLNQVSYRESTELLAANPDTVRPFEIVVDEAAIADLHARLALTRLPDHIPGTSWEYGTELSYLDE
ncbi:MAG: epoxide hydrolase N-terminal domain-containing protein, partial [Pseudomonadota bacterium]|nr:epoxide hydrolase N-terminal domain-containing protein [Pseudomonadota bacterium]